MASMNDFEYADLTARQQHARSLGYAQNAYVCIDCLSEGKTQGNSTYTDWPADVVQGAPKCSRHAGITGYRPLTHYEFLLNEARFALDALADEQRADLFAEYCMFCGAKDSSCPCMRDE